MDFQQLAEDFLEGNYASFKDGPQRRFDESMRGEAFVLLYLSRQPGSVQPGNLSAAMGVSTARIAAALNGLEKRGMVTRRIDTQDRRRILVDLTPEGRQAAQRHRQTILDHTARMFELLGEEDATEFVRIWDRFRELAPMLYL